MNLDAHTLMASYARGFFPMCDLQTGEITWYNPDPRAVLPLDGLRVTDSLARRVRSGRFRVTTDVDFEAVIRACAAPRGMEHESWIDEGFIQAYGELQRRGRAHSIEVWREGVLVGGLYGVHLGAVFMGESMFSRPRLGGTDASKVALVWLVAHLLNIGVQLLDVQFISDHMRTMGAIELDRREYLARLEQGLSHSAAWIGWPQDPSSVLDALDPG